jgi:hypothetical protein
VILIRALTHAIHASIGPFHDINVGGAHVHHLVWGVLLLLGVGYLWLIEAGTGDPHRSLLSRLTSAAFGVGAALTLDEFALWLNLKDVYWERQGRESVEALLIFAALLSVGFWGAPLFHALLRGEEALIDKAETLVGDVESLARRERGPEPVDRPT